MKQTSNRSDAPDLGQAEASRAGDLPVELKPGVMGTVIVRLLSGEGPLGRRRGARFFADDDMSGDGLVAGFGEEEEDFDEAEDEEDFDEEDELGDDEDDEFDDEDDEADEEFGEEEDEEEDGELGEEAEEEEFDDEE